MMRLKVMMPTEIVVDERIQKVVVEGGEGVFCIKPKHTDYVTALVPGLLIYTCKAGNEHYLAIDEGSLIKCGSLVRVLTRHAVTGSSLDELNQLVKAHFHELDEHARKARTASARLELGLVRKYIDLQELC